MARKSRKNMMLWSLECRENMALLSSAGISIAFNIQR